MHKKTASKTKQFTLHNDIPQHHYLSQKYINIT